ncbi:MAG: hypothetical protein JWM96_1169 [Alphaproteobacteria bacterium]|nr:hypothetical protein [Alphaproteobacteria bacterium]
MSQVDMSAFFAMNSSEREKKKRSAFSNDQLFSARHCLFTEPKFVERALETVDIPYDMVASK